jgi:hypothetical protein
VTGALAKLFSMLSKLRNKCSDNGMSVTYDHRLRRIGLSSRVRDTLASRIQNKSYPRFELLVVTWCIGGRQFPILNSHLKSTNISFALELVQVL